MLCLDNAGQWVVFLLHELDNKSDGLVDNYSPHTTKWMYAVIDGVNSWHWQQYIAIRQALIIHGQGIVSARSLVLDK